MELPENYLKIRSWILPSKLTLNLDFFMMYIIKILPTFKAISASLDLILMNLDLFWRSWHPASGCFSLKFLWSLYHFILSFKCSIVWKIDFEASWVILISYILTHKFLTFFVDSQTLKLVFCRSLLFHHLLLPFCCCDLMRSFHQILHFWDSIDDFAFFCITMSSFLISFKWSDLELQEN